jgi:hypothetical protein
MSIIILTTLFIYAMIDDKVGLFNGYLVKIFPVILVICISYILISINLIYKDYRKKEYINNLKDKYLEDEYLYFRKNKFN